MDAPVETLPGIGPKRASLLDALGIVTVRDLLLYLPRAYQDRRTLTPIAEAVAGETITVEAEVVSAKALRLRGRMKMTVATLRDTTGTMQATWFGRDFIARALPQGARGLFTGLVGNYKGLALKNPEYELLSGDEEDLLNTGRVVPIYRLTDGVSQRMLRRWVRDSLEIAADRLEDALPESLRLEHGFPDAGQALRIAHFPAEPEQGLAARSRFAYEELLAMQIGILRIRAEQRTQVKGYRHTLNGPHLRTLRARLPFALTAAQQRAVDDLLADLEAPRPMLRLLQGDVGCGKTVVALHAIAAAADGGYQTALMAPTEILAEQHAITLRESLTPLGIDVALLTGSTREARTVRGRVADGNAQVIVGTHALVQLSVEFARLGLVIVDEQHRFGVMQRQALAEKGLNPDVLHMTATPIPRTLAITLYGGMDLSVIDELPPGRLPVKTRRVPAAKLEGLYQYVAEQANKGFQTYVICPLVDESDAKELKAATAHFEELSNGPLTGLCTGLLHGRMKGDEKEAVMRAFKEGALDVLVSTTVIEVGIDVPRATTMIIEDAAQFGLTQLHQLRGRVGRGGEQSHCFLLGAPKTPEGRKRLEIFCATANGFEIAEADLEMRGPGEFAGLRQAGLSDLRAADLVRDARLLDRARRDAQALLETDPTLQRPEHAALAARSGRFSSVSM